MPGFFPPSRLLNPKALAPLSHREVCPINGEGSTRRPRCGTPVDCSLIQMDQPGDIGGQSDQDTATRQSEAELADAILNYLSEYPQAMDTLEGISEWWVMRAQVRVEVDALLRILRQLIERGGLEEIGPEENPRYQIKSRPPVDE